MTEQEAITIAERKAQDLHIPWSREDITAKYRRFWPFAGFWTVVARVKSEGAITTIKVTAQTGFAIPKDVAYPAGGFK